jgi:predicted nucleic acid-binding protein
MATAYLDASAMVKLVRREPESDALVAALEGVEVRVSSIVGRVELGRAIQRADEDVERALEHVLSELEFVPLHVASAAAAAAVGPRRLRSLDAIHLSTAIELGDDIEAFYCYDQRLADAAREHGIDVRSPGAPA